MIIPPAKSAIYQKVIRATQGQASRLRELFWLTNAPSDLYMLPTVLENLREITSVAEDQWNLRLFGFGLRWLPDLLRVALPLVNSLDISFDNDNDQRPSGAKDQDPIDATRNAMFAALRFSQPNPALQRQFRLLQAHCLFAHVRVMRKTNIERYEHYGGTAKLPEVQPYFAGLAIRRFSEHGSWANEALRILPLDLYPPLFAECERPTVPAEVARFSTINRYIGYIGLFIEQAYGLTGRREFAHRTRINPSSPAPAWPSETGDPDDPSFNMGITSYLPPAHEHGSGGTAPGRKKNALEAETRDRLRWDDCPDEEEEDWFDWHPNEEYYDQSPGSYEAGIAAQCNQLIRENKLFPFGYRSLLASELVEIEITFRKNAEELLSQETLSQEQLDDVEGWMLLLLMLWTGSSENRARQLRFVRDERSNRDCQLAIVSPSDRATAMFRLQVPFPKYSQELTAVSGLAREKQEYMLLPDAASLGPLFRRLNKLQLQARRAQPQAKRADGAPRAEPPSDMVFHRPAWSYQEQIRRLLKTVDPDQRVTISKIAHTLFSRIIAITGKDIVAAVMITGQNHYVAKVAMFYACRQLSKLQAIYRDAVWSLQAEIWREGSSPPPAYPRVNFAIHSRFVARRPCPTTKAVKDAIAALVEQVRNPEAVLRSKGRNCYHNLYTLFTLWHVAFATGVRAITTPFISSEEISPLNSTALMRDKDSDAGFKAKLVWIPDSVRQQLENYEEHVSTDDFRLISQLPCFFFRDDGKHSPVKPSTLAPFIDDFLPGFQSAIHRRFMFNTLLEAGCPPEVVRVWMGHATTGDEPWSRNATFSYSHYRSALRTHLVPILAELGLTPERSLLAGVSH